jgi:hypothetical protein
MFNKEANFGYEKGDRPEVCAKSKMQTNFNKGGNNLEFEFNVSMFRWRRGNERFGSQMPKVQPGPGYTSL